MRNILVIARKELLSTFRQRNLLLLMFVSPIVLVVIMGLAFGGLGGNSGPQFTDIRLVVVNLDEGFNVQQLSRGGGSVSLDDVEVPVAGQSVNLGEALAQNDDLGVAAQDFAAGDFTLNFGNQLAAILLSQPLTGTGMISGTGFVSGTGSAFDLSTVVCPLLPEDEQDTGYEDSLSDLFTAELWTDADAARTAVERGDFAAAVIIPAGFSRALVPDFGLAAQTTTSDTVINDTVSNNTGITTTGDITGTGRVEVIANNATPISGSIVRAVVEGIVGQFERMNVALNALVQTAIDEVVSADLTQLDPSAVDIHAITQTLQGADTGVLAPLGCLIKPGANNVQASRQPLSEVQTRSTFSMLMVVLGGSQAVFFALFTGVFGINAIYEDRRQGTLQRVLASPTPSSHVLFGRLLGNLVVVMCQLAILLTAFTTIATIVEGQPTFIWGTNVPALLLVISGLSLFTTGLGVMVVGLASSSEQVQLIGPIITIALGALGGLFGSLVPRSFGQFSPTWWGIDAMGKLAAGESDIALNLVVLWSAGLLFALVGTYFFKRRMGL